MDYLCELPTDADRRSALSSLPPTLNATYERILRWVNKSNSPVQTLVRRALQWIVHAGGPLNISTLCEAVSVEAGCDSLEYDVILAEDELLRWCSSLVRKTGSGDALELAHFTVKEFLLGLNKDPTNELAIYGLDKVRDDIDLAVVCLTVLLAWDPVDDDSSLWSYAVQWWAYHAGRNMENKQIFSLTKRFMDPAAPERLILWAEEFQQRRSQGLIDDEHLSTASPLHYASLLALPQVCQWLIEQGCDVNKASDLGTPLHCVLLGIAAMNGENQGSHVQWGSSGRPDLVEDTLRVLLSAGSDTRTRYNDPLFPCTPLGLAIRLNNKSAYIEMLRLNVVLDNNSLQFIEPDLAHDILVVVGEGRLSYTNHAQLIAKALQYKYYQIGETFSALDRRQKLDPHLHVRYNECLWYAAKFGQVLVISQLLNELQLDINVRDSRNGFAALHYAAESGHADAFEFLLQQGADYSIVDLEGKTPFSFFIGSIHSHDLARYLQLDIDLLQRDKNGQSLWHCAAQNKNPDILSTLTAHVELQHHANALIPHGESRTMPIDCDQMIRQPAIYHNIQSHDATRPLHVAAEAGSFEAVKFLLDNGADVQGRKLDGSNALHCAVNGKSRAFNVDIVHTLIEHGLDPVSSRLDKSTPTLMLIQRPRFLGRSFPGEYSVLERLIQHKPTLTVTDDDGLTVIHHLCQLISQKEMSPLPLKSFQYRTLQLMLENGAEMHSVDYTHRAPLQVLLDVLREEYLRANKIGIVQPSKRAQICVEMINATYKYIGHHEQLTDLWREPDLLVLALWIKHDELVHSLLQLLSDADTTRGVTNLTPIEAACRFGCSAPIMKSFMDKSRHFSGPVSSASALIIEACKRLNREYLPFGNKPSGCLEALLSAGADPCSCSESGTTALMVAARSGNIEIMDLLILAGADLSATDNIGWTVIHYICLHVVSNERAVFQKLRIPSVGWISTVNYTWHDHNYRNVTALHIAASTIGRAALEETLESGLVHALDATSDEGYTALMFATTIGEFRKVKLLLRKGADANPVNRSCGQSASHIAAAKGYRKIASLLVRHGGDLSVKDLNDMTPAICARKNGHRKLASILDSYRSSEGVFRSRHGSYNKDFSNHQLAISQERRMQARVTRHQWLTRAKLIHGETSKKSSGVGLKT